MKLRDTVFLVIGGLLVISGMVLNTLISGDVEEQVGVKDVGFGLITCKGLYIIGDGEARGFLGLGTDGKAILQIFGDDMKTPIAYLGEDKTTNEMLFTLTSKSKTDKREVSMGIDENGGRFDGFNKMGENVVRLAVGSSGGGGVDFRDKFGYVK